MLMYYNNISSALKRAAADFDAASDAITSSQSEIDILKNRASTLEKRIDMLETYLDAYAWDINEIRNDIELKEKINKEKIIDIINILMRD